MANETDGYQMIIDAINQFGDRYDPYRDIDLGATLSNIFRKKKKAEVQLPEFKPVEFSAPGIMEKPKDYQSIPQPNFDSSPLPMPKVDTSPTAGFSPENPYAIDNSGFWQRKMTPQRLAKMQAWEENRAKEDLANRLAEMDLKNRQLTYDINQKKLEALNNPEPSGLTPYEAEKLKLDWYKATKPDKEEAPKDPLLMSYKDLDNAIRNKGEYDTSGNAARQRYLKQYSAAIRANINDPKKAQQYIDRYNYLAGTGFTYDQWVNQSQREYNPATNRPVVAQKSTSVQKPTKQSVKTIQLKNKKTGEIVTAYIGLKDGQYYSTEAEARVH